jgi:hypothetical protein
MILSRSPYYITAPMETGTESITLTMKVNQITQNTSMVNTDYTVVKNPVSTEIDSIDFEVSNILRDYLDPRPPETVTTTGLEDSRPNSVISLNYVLDYQGITNTVTSTMNTVLDGYGYFKEGANPQTTKKILLTNNHYLVNKNGFFLVPILNDGTYSEVTIDGHVHSLNTSSALTDKVKYLVVNVSEFSGTVLVKVGSEEVTLEVIEECKYPPFDVCFLNRYGVFEIMTFFKQSQVSTKLDSKVFKNNYISNGQYDTTRHTYKEMNKNGQESLKLNSGWVSEQYNETIRELLLSEKVYLWKNGDEDYLTPMVVETSSLEYKTRVKDKLISYEIDLKYANDIINNI